VFFLLLLSFYATILRGLVTCLFYSLLYIYIYFRIIVFVLVLYIVEKVTIFFRFLVIFLEHSPFFLAFESKMKKILSLTLISNSIREKKRVAFTQKSTKKNTTE
jgi:hypothetical protein